MVAESNANAACSPAGLGLELRSIDYVASWLDDSDVFKTEMAAIHA